MGIIGGQLGFKLLGWIAPQSGEGVRANVTDTGEVDLIHSFGDTILDKIKDKVVIDFGCGPGKQSVAMAQNGAQQVVGIDIQTHLLDQAIALSRERGVDDICSFGGSTDIKADLIVSRDAFEHFHRPAAILECMADLLKPGGRVLASFGPTWYHPYGGHLFSMFPWSHLIFTEKALIRWRAQFKRDGATKFAEVTGGLNRMTIRRFEKIVAASPFRLVHLSTVPIRGLSFLQSRLLREFGSSCVRAELVVR